MGENKPKWKDTELPESTCPFCDNRLDHATSPTGLSPSPGDISVCINCASPLIFDQELKPRIIAKKELDGFSSEEREMLEKYQRVIRALDRR